jgi:hypothetical protein
MECEIRKYTKEEILDEIKIHLYKSDTHYNEGFILFTKDRQGYSVRAHGEFSLDEIEQLHEGIDRIAMQYKLDNMF